MRTLDAASVPASRLMRFSRDVKLLLRLASMLISYLSRGTAIRHRYRRLERRGETYWLDDG